MKAEKKTLRKHILLNGWQIGELESWFSDMAADGLILQKCGLMRAEFVRGEGTAYRYRIDITPKSKEMPEEQKALYAEGGWEYVCRLGAGMMHVLRSPESAKAAELHTDPAEQSYTIHYLSRRMRIASVFAGIAIALNVFLLYWVLFSTKTPFLNLVEGTVSNIPLVFLLMLYTNGTIIWGAIALSRLIRRMREGRALHHKADWRRPRRSALIAAWISILFGLFTIAFPIYGLVGILSRETVPLTDDISYPILRLSEIESDAGLTVYTGPDNLPEYLRESYNRVTKRWSPFAPELLETEEHGTVPGRLWSGEEYEYRPSLTCKIYRVAAPWLAEGLLGDLRKQYVGTAQTVLLKTERPGFDTLYTTDNDGFYHVLFAKCGNIVMQVRYSGEEDLEYVIAVLRGFLERR